MNFRADDRAVTVQVGAIFLLGFLVLSMSIFQTTVVPNENEDVEFAHSQRVQEDMLTVRSSVLAGAARGSAPATTIELGTTYPPRSVFINPPPAGGSLRTVALGDVEIADAVVSSNPETEDYWGGTERTYATSALRYEPAYNEYRGAPTTVLENALVYNQFEGAAVNLSSQSVIRGRRVSIVTLSGSFARNEAGAITADTEVVSASTRTVAITGPDASTRIRLTIPTQRTAAEWRGLLREAGQFDGDDSDPDAYVDEVSDAGADGVYLYLEAGETYDLKLSKVGLGTGVDDPDPAYITTARAPNPSIDNDTSERIVVEVRDAYNNPVSGVTVSGAALLGSLDAATRETDEDGRAAFTYTAPGPTTVGETDDVSLEITDSPEEHERVQYAIRITGAGGAGPGAGGGGGSTGSQINPNSTNAIVLNDATLSNTQCGEGNSPTCNVTVTMENLDPDNSQKITQARFNFYSVDQRTGTGNNRGTPVVAILTRHGQANVELLSANQGGQYKAIVPNATVPAGGTKEVNLRFYSDQSATDEFEVLSGDFFVISIIIDEKRTSTYFVAPS